MTLNFFSRSTTFMTYHQVKNAHALLERGTHFDGENIYDAIDLTLIMSTGTNEVAKKMNKGVAHGTLAQLDKHSD